MDLSIVIATRNRAHFLQSTLESISRIQTAFVWELVVVDNASHDQTSRVLEEFRTASPLTVRVLREERSGGGRARNVGWRAAAGAVIGFFDDDCYPAPDYVDQVHRCFASPEVGFIGGRILLHDPTDLRITIQERAEKMVIPARDFIPAGLLQGANWAVRRKALAEVGGFDPNLGSGTPFFCEELELQARLSAAGWVGVYDPGPVTYHHHRRKSPADRGALERAYDLGRGAYYAKCLLNPQLRMPYAKRWFSSMRRSSATRVRRELGAAAYYFWLRARGKLEVCP